MSHTFWRIWNYNVMYYDMIFALLSTNQMEKSKPINTCTTLTYYLTINNKQVLWFLSKTAVNEEHILDLQSILIHVCTIYLSFLDLASFGSLSLTCTESILSHSQSSELFLDLKLRGTPWMVPALHQTAHRPEASSTKILDYVFELRPSCLLWK